jgi:hypothetical protein
VPGYNGAGPAGRAVMMGRGRGFCAGPLSFRESGARRGCRDLLHRGRRFTPGIAWLRAWRSQGQNENEYWLQYQCDLEEELAYVKKYNEVYR